VTASVLSRGGTGRSQPVSPRTRKGRGTLAIASLLVGTAIAGCGFTYKGHPPKPPSYPPNPPSYSGEATARTLFKQDCSSCHMLHAANATFGTFGPDLDHLTPAKWQVLYQLMNGGFIMPAFGRDRILTPAEIQALATYVVTVAGK
jgi:mono/diheme cytochrome c family protein